MANRNKLSRVGGKPGNQGVVKKRLGKPIPNRGSAAVMDARQKIIQKKRNTVVDARDILAKMAKKQDARNKILKIREQRKGENVLNGNIRAIGSGILQKTDRNGKISLVTNKTKQSTHDLNLAVRQQLGLVSNVRPVAAPIKKIITKRPVTVPLKETMRNFTPPVIRKTILNDFEYAPAPVRPQPNYLIDNSADAYRWYRQDVPPQHLVVTRQNGRALVESSNVHYRNYSVGSSRPSVSNRPSSSSYIDLDAMDDEEMPLAPSTKPVNRLSNIHSRLDNNPSEPQTHGILGQPKAKVVVPVGHRIVVSNLQSTVTQDDIRELFEDIGQLLVARLVRPGTAEVIYKNLKDAQKAVDTYHNRQLDGQPMKCLLVNKRPINNPTAPAITTSPSATKSVSDGFLGIRKSSSINNSNKLVPDLSTIHKVLFQRNN